VGLAIADRAVRLHHGNLSAANRPGGGATFRILLPQN
jgi:signal transduction histidine kinase